MVKVSLSKKAMQKSGDSPEINPVGTSVPPWVSISYFTIILDMEGLNRTDSMFLVIIMK